MRYSLSLLVATTTLVAAHVAPRHDGMQRRAPATTTRGARETVAKAAAITSAAALATGGAQLPLSDLTLIGTATTAETTQTLPSTFAAGATPPVKGAPVLPSIANINPANYPTLDKQPPIDSPEVQQWISEINMAGIPNIPVTGINGCANTTANADNIAKAGADGYCWWTCGGCTRATDVTFCPQKNTWGLSYDDGPSPDTPRLLNYMQQNNIKSTFYVVGSRVISRPQFLQTEYMLGHQISVHTWAHPPLTTLSNEVIIAELGWSKKVIKDVLGVTPNRMRPPYGDVDDRVRYIAEQMGLTVEIWTAANGNTFDTRDWQIAAGVVNSTSVYNNFATYLDSAVTTLDHGFIVLEHDLYQQSVDLAVNFVLPAVLNGKQLTLEPIIQCLGNDPSEGYIETASNKTLISQVTTTLPGASGIGYVTGVSNTSPSAATSTSSSSGSTSGSSGSSDSGSSGSGSGSSPSGGTSAPANAAGRRGVSAFVLSSTIAAALFWR